MLTTSDALARWLTKPGGPGVGPVARRDRCFPECAASARRVTRGAPVGCVARGVTRAFLPTRTDRAGAVCAGARHASEPIATRRGDVVRAGARGNRASGETGAADDGAFAATLAVLGAAARTGGERARRGDVTSASAMDVAPERDETRLSDDSRRRRRSGPDAKRARSGEDGEKAKKRRKRRNPRGDRNPRRKANPPKPDRAGFDDDGGWRHRSKRALQDDIARYVDVAAAALEAERSAEAAAAAAMSSSEAGDDARATASSVDRDVPEGTIVGRAGAMMGSLRLASARPSPGKNGRLLNLRVEGGGALPASALSVGDRVAAVLMDERDGGDDDSGFVSVSCDVDEARWSLSDTEALISEMDPANGVLTLLEATKKAGPKAIETPNETRDARLSESLEQTLGGRLVRLVRVPDATTYERQIAALRTLRNVPTSRTNPPSARIVRALFAAARCPPAGATSSDDDDEEIAGDLSPSKAFVAGHFAAAPDVAEAFGDAAKTNVKTPFRALGFDQLPPLDVRPSAEGGGGPLPAGFDDAQALAVRAALCGAAPVCWIQGPPGTGKTKVVLEIIRRAVASGSRVLACAPSNAAVDNLVERLAEAERDGASVSFVRVGAPERISDAALESSLEARVRDATAGYFDQARSTRRRELVDATRRGWEKRDELRRSGGKTRGPGDAKLSRRALDAKLSRLRGEQKKMAISGRKTRAKAEREILANADVVLATTVGAGAENIQKLPAFDMLVLDEAAQATEPAAWIPLVRCARAVLVGDPRQLAPLVRSEEARRRGLGTPVMARVSVPQQRRAETRRSSEGAEENDAPASALLSGGVLGCALRTQYRSHAAISDWASRETYGGALAASPSVATRLLRDLPGVVATAATTAPLLLLDTRVASGALLSGCAEATERDLLASLSDYGTLNVAGDATSAASFSSLVNEGEAYAVTMHVAGLLRAGVTPEQIAVQSPYAAQVRLMQCRLREAARIGLAPGAERVEVASVDSFQGREAEAVVVSTVRSNDRRAVGFLADARRANVAVTRARRHVAVVGDSRTVGADPFLARLLAHIRENGVRSPADAHERLHEPLR